MFQYLILLIVLLFSAILTVHLLSWVGSVLHSVPSVGDSGYAVFTFRDDYNKSMSTNIFMNILIPNVCLIFLYMGIYYSNLDLNYNTLIFYVLFYYLYRSILICTILKRKELYNIVYESFISFIGIFLAYLLLKFFLINPQDVFIEVKELVNEFWLLVILVIYRFVILLLDKFFSTRKVVSSSMLNKYIIKMFKIFYKKYSKNISVSEEDKYVWILIYSIMIFENYNRNKVMRFFERLKIRSGKVATTGIMQIKSNKLISDEESIILAYQKLKFEIMKESLDVDDEMQIEYYAWEYNPDEDYAKSVSYIYTHLKEFLCNDRQYKEIFCLEDIKIQDEFEEEFNLENNELDKNTSIEETFGYYTIYDVMLMSGLSKKEIKQLIKKNKLTIYLSDDEVEQNFNEYMIKG